MTIPAVPTVPNPLGTNFANEALAFTQWMAAAAPEFDAAADRANLAQSGAQDAATQSGLARDAAVVAQGAASDSADAAALASSAASDAKIAAESARDSAATTYIDFDKRFLGDKSAPPTADNQGGPLVEGALYYNTVQKSMRVWSGSEWDAAYLPSGAYQETLVSGVNIKTVNGQNLLGSGDLASVGPVARLAKSAAYTASDVDKGALIDCTGTWTLGLTAAATLGAGWWCYVRNTGNGDITIDPDDVEQIGGQSTYVLKPGYTILLQCDGIDFTALELKKRTYSQRLQITSTQDFIVPADTYVIRAYAVGAGGDGSVSRGGSGGGMAYGDIAVTPGETLSVTIANRIAKVSRGATDLLVGNPAAHTVTTVTGAAGTASKHASVTHGGEYSGGVGGTPGASSGSPLGTGVNGYAGQGGGSGWGGVGGYNSANAAGGGGGVGGAGGGGEAVGVGGAGGPGLPYGVPIADPLLHDCVARENTNQGINSQGANGLPGQGGGGAGKGGIAGGVGGFGGGGGAGAGGGAGGAGGVGGGGGAGGVGGAAAVIIIWD